ncbi:MAG: hypothetical protein RJA58_1271 [Pseudomonadota bacterium]
MSQPSDNLKKPRQVQDPCLDPSFESPQKNGDVSKRAFPDSPASHHPEDQMDWLVKTIEAEIIPRLMAAHQEEGGDSVEASLCIRQEEVDQFTDIALRSESAICQNFVESIRNRGVPLQAIYLYLFAPAARKLDAMWVADQCDFTEITVALWRMQQVMYDLSPAFRNDQEQWGAHRRKIMLMPVPGSQHTLGILMVAEFFRRAGWSVWGEPAASRERLIEAVAEEYFDIAGISVGSESQLEGLPEFITELRRHSKNGQLVIMAGGPLLVHHPEIAAQIGADTTAADAEHAILEAERIVATHQQFLQTKESRHAS